MLPVSSASFLNQIARKAHWAILACESTSQTTLKQSWESFIKQWLCKTNESDFGTACGSCTSCLLWDIQKQHPDVLKASGHKIEMTKAIQSFLEKTGAIGKRKLIWWPEIEKLTEAAANALLKILEEPPMHCGWLLQTTDLHRVPLTLQSRCYILGLDHACPVPSSDAPLSEDSIVWSLHRYPMSKALELAMRSHQAPEAAIHFWERILPCAAIQKGWGGQPVFWENWDHFLEMRFSFFKNPSFVNQLTWDAWWLRWRTLLDALTPFEG